MTRSSEFISPSSLPIQIHNFLHTSVQLLAVSNSFSDTYLKRVTIRSHLFFSREKQNREPETYTNRTAYFILYLLLFYFIISSYVLFYVHYYVHTTLRSSLLPCFFNLRPDNFFQGLSLAFSLLPAEPCLPPWAFFHASSVPFSLHSPVHFIN